MNGGDIQPMIEQIVGSALALAQALLNRPGSARLWLVTRGAQRVELDDACGLAPAHASLWGFGRSLANEHPDRWGGLIDLDPKSSPTEAADSLPALLKSPGPEQWALRSGRNFVLRLARHTPARTDSLPIDPEGSYLITGGLGGVGLALAHGLAARGARHLALLSRHAPTLQQQAALDALAAQGATVQHTIADVCDPQALAIALAAVRAVAPLKGVIHAAGVLDDGVVLRQSWDRTWAVLAPKVLGSWALHQQTASDPLAWLVLCSSAAGLLGAPGQSGYAAANTWLDSLAALRQGQGGVGVSIAWGPWAAGGMQARRPRAGLGTISSAAGIEALAAVGAGATAQVAVLPLDPAAQPQDGTLPPLIAALVSEHAPEARLPTAPEGFTVAPDPPIFEQILAVLSTERQRLIRGYLQQRIARVLHADEETINDDRNLTDFGMDSLMVIDVLNDCKSNLRIALHPREFYERPSFGQLAQYIAAEFERAHGPANASPKLGMDLPPAVAQAEPSAAIGQLTSSGTRLPSAIFLLSSPRAGSTLLRVMLAGHPNLFCPPELHLLPFETMARRSAALSGSYLNEGLERALMELIGLDATGSKATIDVLASQDAPIRQVYALLQQHAGQRVLVDKSPSYAVSLEVLQRAEALFQGARYIHLTRHPYAVIESFVRNRFDRLLLDGSGDPYRSAEQAWTTTNDNIMRFFAEIDPARRHVVRFEDLVAQPEATMRAVCVFLGLPFDSAVLAPYSGQRMTDGIHPTSRAIGDPNFLNHGAIEPDLGQAWRTVVLPSPLGAPARDLARRLAYELSEPAALAVAEITMEESFVDVRGLRLCVCAWGPPDGQPVLCLHGILDHGASWELVAAYLAGRGLRVIAPDLRGHGRSDHVSRGSSYHLIDMLGDVDALISALGDRPLTLVGHSMGAALAAVVAAARPQRVAGLVLIEPPSFPAQDDQLPIERIAVQLDYLAEPQSHPTFPGVHVAAERLRSSMPALSEAWALRMAERLTERCAGGVRWRWDAALRTRAGLGFDGTFTSAGYHDLLNRLAAPTILIYGDGFDGAAARTPEAFIVSGARRVILHGGHALHIDAPEELAELIKTVIA